MKVRLNPVYKKELKLSVRTMKMALIILFYNGLLAAIGLLSFYLTFSARSTYGNINYSDALSIYMVIAVIEIGLVLFVVPAFTAGSISGEREKQTLEILLTTRLKPIQIVIGKLASSISTILLLVFSSLPILSIVFTVGGIGLKDLVQLLFLTAILAIFIGSMGIFFSTLFKRTIPATVFTYGGVIFFTIGTFFIVGVLYLLAANAANQSYMSAVAYQAPDIRNAVLILLFNPIFMVMDMMTTQYGVSNFITTVVGEFGTCSSFFLKNWFWCSVAAQMVASVCFVLGAARLLNPLKRKSKARKIKGSKDMKER